MPLVEISLWPGRTDETKEKIIAEVTDAIVRSCGAPPESVTIILREVPKSHWARAGKPFSKTHPG